MTTPGPEQNNIIPSPSEMDGQLAEQQARTERIIERSENPEILNELERGMLLDIHWSFLHSQGSVPTQHMIMEYQRRQRPAMTAEQVDAACEKLLPQLVAYHKFKPPKRHTKDYGTNEPLAADKVKNMVVSEYQNRVNDYANIMKYQSVYLEEDESGLKGRPVTSLHELSDERLTAEITLGMLRRDLEYVRSGRPGRNTDTERYKSFFREFVLNQHRAQTPALRKLYEDIGNVVERLGIVSSGQTYHIPEETALDDTDITLNKVALMHFNYTRLVDRWEFKNFGQEFIPKEGVTRAYDFEAHYKALHTEIYLLRQATISEMSNYGELQDVPADKREAAIRAELEKDPNFVSMHAKLMASCSEPVEALLDAQTVDEGTREKLRRVAYDTVSFEIEHVDPQLMGDQSMNEYIAPVLTNIIDHRVATEQTERFKQAKEATEPTAAENQAVESNDLPFDLSVEGLPDTFVAIQALKQKTKLRPKKNSKGKKM